MRRERPAKHDFFHFELHRDRAPGGLVFRLFFLLKILPCDAIYPLFSSGAALQTWERAHAGGEEAMHILSASPQARSPDTLSAGLDILLPTCHMDAEQFFVPLIRS